MRLSNVDCREIEMALTKENLNGEEVYRIRLPRNGAELIVEGKSVASRVYLFAGKQGDNLSISLASLDGDPFFGVTEPHIKFSVTQFADERADWSGRLPLTSDFAIRVFSFPLCTYQLRLRLKRQRQWLSLYFWFCEVVTRARLVAGY